MAAMLGLLLLSWLPGRALALHHLRTSATGGRARRWVPEAHVNATGWGELTSHLAPFESHSLMQGGHFGHYSPDDGYYIGNTDGIERLGLPPLKMQDGGNGFRNTLPGTAGTTLAWPCALALASTWDDSLVYRVASAMGREFKGKGANVMLGPGVNVQRTAMNGRNFEYLSGEDPYLGSRLTTSFVKGVQEQGVIATLKHFAFNEQETHRTEESSIVDDHTAWELYYPPFEAGVNAGAGAVMCSYNKVNGQYACHNGDLLNRDLRGRMGFKGIVMSDWGATHGVDAISAGMDQEMPGRAGGGVGVFTPEAVSNFDPEYVDAATVHIREAMRSANLVNATGECRPPEGCMGLLQSNQLTKAHKDLARKAATDAVVLLKNDGDFLPFDRGRVKKIAVMGDAAVNKQEAKFSAESYFAGGGSGHVGGRPCVSALAGIHRRAAKDKVQVVSPQNTTTLHEQVDVVLDADAVVIVAATTSTEGKDRATLNLDSNVDFLIHMVKEIGKPMVVLMQTPGAVLMPWAKLSHVRAIANLFLGGEETGNAWAAVLFGDAAPSGKLPIMFPLSEDDQIKPAQDMHVPYSEGLFTSYRSPRFKAEFPFGHGLSYTTFEYGKPRAAPHKCSGKACVKFNLTNTGQRSGSEVVQAYIQFGDRDHLKEPKQTLRGFKKVLLAPGERTEVTLAFTARDLSLYRNGTWARQKEFIVHLGSSSNDIRGSVHLAAK